MKHSHVHRILQALLDVELLNNQAYHVRSKCPSNLNIRVATWHMTMNFNLDEIITLKTWCLAGKLVSLIKQSGELGQLWMHVIRTEAVALSPRMGLT